MLPETLYSSEPWQAPKSIPVIINDVLLSIALGCHMVDRSSTRFSKRLDYSSDKYHTVVMQGKIQVLIKTVSIVPVVPGPRRVPIRIPCL